MKTIRRIILNNDTKVLYGNDGIYTELNNIHPISRGSFLYDLYKK